MSYLRTFQQSLLGLLLASCVLSCSSVSVERYSNNNPKLIIESFFNGRLTAHGVVKNRSGVVIRYFNASIEGSWKEDGTGTLHEQFVFDDGEQQTRIWTLIPNGDGTFKATANDVTGEAQGRASGNSFFMDYILQVPYKKRVLDVHVDDRMYLVNPNTLLNESQLTKFGFNVGSVLITIIKHEPPTNTTH